MLRLFRLNDPYRLVLIFLILILIRTAWLVYGLPHPIFGFKWLVLGEWLAQGHTMYSETYDYTGPLSTFVYKWLDMIFGNTRWTHIILSTLLIIFQAGLLNNILLKNKAFDENTYVVAFLYVILMCGIMDYFTLSPQLMSMTFIIVSLNNIFRRIDNEVTDELFLTSGIYLGLATFLYLPSVIYLVAFLLSFIFFSSAVIRRLLLLAYGTVVVFLVIWGYFFWFGSYTDFLDSFFIYPFMKEKLFYISYSGLFLQSLVIAFFLLLSLTVVLTTRFSNFQQKIQRVMFLFLLAALIATFISADLTGAEIIFFIPSVAFFLTHYLLSLRKRWARMILPGIFVLLILGFPFYWIRTNVSKELFLKAGVQTENKRIMLIGNDLSVYHGNTVASPFLDEYISRKKIEGLNYYEDAAKIFDVIMEANPDIILDQWEIYPQMKSIFPVLGTKYRADGDQRYVRISN